MIQSYKVLRAIEGKENWFTHVADVAVFMATGKAVISWIGEHRSVAVYDSFESLKDVHGHPNTRFERDDDIGWKEHNRVIGEFNKWLDYLTGEKNGCSYHDDYYWHLLDEGIRLGKILITHMQANRNCQCEMCKLARRGIR